MSGQPGDGSVRVRPTVRVLLLDPLDRVLLYRFEDERVSDPALPPDRQPRSAWALIGGGIQDGESLIEAARRELHEETGLTSVALGRVVLERRKSMLIDGDPVLFDERILIGRTRATVLSWEGLEPAERIVFQEMRWWPLADLRATEDVIFPDGLADLIAELTRAAT